MKRCYTRTLIPVSIIISLLIFILSFSGCNFTGEKKYTIGIVNLTSQLDNIIAGFKAGMADRGYINKRNITYIYNGALSNRAYLDEEIKGMISRGVDLILTATSPAALAAKEHTKGTNIPVVFAPVFLPVETGIVTSLTGHGTNMTGVWVGGSTAKALEYLLAVSPNVKKVFAPFNANNAGARQSLAALKIGADKLSVQIIAVEVHSPDELKKSLNNISSDVDAIWLLNSPFLVSNIASYMEAAIQHKLPLASGASQYESGVLISYGQKHFRTGQQASNLADKILRGTAPSDLMIEQCDFILGINMQTARAIGMDIPNNILNQADHIVR